MTWRQYAPAGLRERPTTAILILLFHRPEARHVRRQLRIADVPDDADARDLGSELVARVHRHHPGAGDGDLAALGLELGRVECAGTGERDREVISATREVARGR